MAKLTVKITLALLGDAAATLLLILLQNLDLLERLQDLAVDRAAGIDMVRGARAAVLGAAVDLAETANTDGFPQVDVASDRGSTDIVPVDVLGGHLLGWPSLDGINPTCVRATVRYGGRRAECKSRCWDAGTNRAQGACPGASRKPRRPLVNR